MLKKGNLRAVGALVLIVSIIAIYMTKSKTIPDVYEYLPELRKCNVYDLKFKEIHSDPSYITPYNVLISFKADDQNIVNILSLKKQSEVDTIALKERTWPEEYRIYFSMNSVNATRSQAIEEIQSSVPWWKPENCNDTYASPFFDQGKRRVVPFGERKNGRIVCCRRDNRYYILIECWG